MSIFDTVGYAAVGYRDRVPTRFGKIRSVVYPSACPFLCFHGNGSPHNEGVLPVYIYLLTIGKSDNTVCQNVCLVSIELVPRRTPLCIPTTVVVAYNHICLYIAFAWEQDVSSCVFEHWQQITHYHLGRKFVFDSRQQSRSLPLPAVESLFVVPTV